MNASTIAQTLNKHAESISPGQPYTLTATHRPGDIVWQGDLGIEIVESVPKDYVLVNSPTDQDRQLVPLGGGPGSHHRLASLYGVRLYRPHGWGDSPAELRGPCVICNTPNEIRHEPGHGKPHGTVSIADPMIVLCRYQRNLTAEERVVRAGD